MFIKVENFQYQFKETIYHRNCPEPLTSFDLSRTNYDFQDFSFLMDIRLKRDMVDRISWSLPSSSLRVSPSECTSRRLLDLDVALLLLLVLENEVSFSELYLCRPPEDPPLPDAPDAEFRACFGFVPRAAASAERHLIRDVVGSLSATWIGDFEANECTEVDEDDDPRLMLKPRLIFSIGSMVLRIVEGVN